MSKEAWQKGSVLYEDWSGGLNSEPPENRIADNQYAFGSQDLRRDRGILETRKRWVHNLGVPTGLGTMVPPGGVFVWGNPGQQFLTYVSNAVVGGTSKQQVTWEFNDIDLTNRSLEDGIQCNFQGTEIANPQMPWNALQYENQLLLSGQFDWFQHPGGYWDGYPRQVMMKKIGTGDAIWYLTGSPLRLTMLGNVLVSWNHRLYYGNDQTGGNHIFHSGPGKRLPVRWFDTSSYGYNGDGHFYMYFPNANYDYLMYVKSKDMFHPDNGGGTIELPEEYGDITAFFPTNNYLFAFTTKAIFRISRDNSYRLVSDMTGTLSQQSIVGTPWGIIFLGFDRKLYAWDGQNQPQIISDPIQNYLDEAYIDTPLYIHREKWIDEGDFRDTLSSGLSWKDDQEGVTFTSTGGATPTTGSWTDTKVLYYSDGIRILSLKPTYTMRDMAGAVDDDEQYLAFFYRYSSSNFDASAGAPAWKYIGLAWERYHTAATLVAIDGGNYHGMRNFSDMDYYPRRNGTPSVPTIGQSEDIALSSTRSDKYSQVYVTFKRNDNNDVGPVLKSLVANILRGDPSMIAAAPNLAFSQGKLRLNIAWGNLGLSYPYCNTSLVFDGRGWDMHVNRDAGRELLWNGRRFWAGCNTSQTGRVLYWDADNISPEPIYDSNDSLISGKLYSKKFDFGNPDMVKTISKMWFKFKQENDGKIRIKLKREYKGDEAEGYVYNDADGEWYIPIDSSGTDKIIGVSVPHSGQETSTALEADIGTGMTFQIVIESAEGAQWQINSIRFEYMFKDSEVEYGMRKVSSGPPS